MKNENKTNAKTNTEVKVNKTVIATVEHHDATTEKPAEIKTEYKPAKRESASSKFMKLFQLAVDNKKINTEIENKLTDKEYCKEQFKLAYPMFKKIIDGKDIKEQRKINNYYRYQSKTIKINETEYLVCNNIYQKQVDAMKKWMSQF
jgi:methyl coenzyme M reductase subunit D